MNPFPYVSVELATAPTYSSCRVYPYTRTQKSWCNVWFFLSSQVAMRRMQSKDIFLSHAHFSLIFMGGTRAPRARSSSSTNSEADKRKNQTAAHGRVRWSWTRSLYFIINVAFMHIRNSRRPQSLTCNLRFKLWAICCARWTSTNKKKDISHQYLLKVKTKRSYIVTDAVVYGKKTDRRPKTFSIDFLGRWFHIIMPITT